MKTQHENQIEVLNDLVKINLDRVEGYEKAISESISQPNLISTFREMVAQSNKNVMELSTKVSVLGGEVTQDTTIPGKIYRLWMEVKSAFSKDRKSILDLCEFGEDAALKAYDMALKAEDELDAHTRELVHSQHAELKRSHDLIKSLRDSAKSF